MTSTIMNEPKLASGIVSNVSNTWKTVRLPNFYREMVVVATPCYDDTKSGAVVRIRNAELRGSTFEVCVENPNGDPVTNYFVNYVVVEAGVHEKAGIKIEAHRIDSPSADHSGSWEGDTFNAQQLYSTPVVLGQVMTANDAWSTFWSFEAEQSVGDSIGPNIGIGRHVGQDLNRERQPETLGVIIFEAGSGEINGVQFTAGHTDTSVAGRGGDPFSQPLDMLGLTAVASPASMNGTDGCWTVLWGNSRTESFQSRSLALKVDEDQIQDSEQAHASEKIGYLVLNGEKDGSRFLAQAGFGGYFSDIRNVFRDGYSAWIDAQKNAPISLTRPYMDDISRIQTQYYDLNYYRDSTDPNVPSYQDIRNSFPFVFAFPNQNGTDAYNFTTAWTRNILNERDQLRQRVAWTLSQIMVVSYKNSNLLRSIGRSFADYYDMLATHALGNFRDLLFGVSTHPLMGYYLSSLGNQKASEDGARQPDENYAREVMQLFSIGLWELNNDGTQKLDADVADGVGQPIPTYDNDDITELARVFTGLWYEGQRFGSGGSLRERQGGVVYIRNSDPREYEMVDLTPLAMFEDYHDQGEKKLFHDKEWETIIPAGQDGMKDIEDAVDALFNHPNTPPFMARRLIQFMVTSNPSPNYIERVASVFINNGEGVRGDMHAVVRQVLLDGEARYYSANPQYGKLIEPMIRLTRAMKAFRSGRNLQQDNYDDPANPIHNDIIFYRTAGLNGADAFGQWPLYSNSVFNFFDPDHQHGGVLVDQDGNNLDTPEFEIFDPVIATTMPNELSLMIEYGLQRTRSEITPQFGFDLTDELNLASNVDALLDRLDILLVEGQMSDGTRNVIKRMLESLPSDTDAQRKKRVSVALFGVLVSPDSAVMR